MRLRLFIIILPFLWWGFEARAQVTGELSSMPQQWQLTLDDIKSKTQSLGLENDGLKAEYRQLIQRVQELQQAINDQQSKNEQMQGFLKGRHGRTDQQARIEDLAQTIKTKRQEVSAYGEQFRNLQRKSLDLDNKVQSLKNTVSDEEFQQQAKIQRTAASQNMLQPRDNDQLAQLRKQLEDGSTQEVLLENELAVLKTGGKSQNLNADAIGSENKQLEARLDILRLGKLAQVNGRRYEDLKERKDQLEAKIYAYESRMDGLRQSSLTALSWPFKKKRLVHAMVQVDALNNQMRYKIKVLREDIEVLRDQVARLERRVDFAQGK